MTSKIFARGERVSVADHDWQSGEARLPGVVRRMASDTHVVVDLDLGVRALAHVEDVERADETQDDRRAA